MSTFSKLTRGRVLSRSVIAAALAFGTAGAMVATAAPAAAKDAAPQLSSGFRALAGPLQKDLGELAKKKGDAAFATSVKAKVAAAIAAAQTPDDKFYAGQFAIQYGTAADDNAVQKQGLELALASGKLPAADVGKFNYYLGAAAFNAKDYTGARTAFANAMQAGYQDPEMPALLAESYFNTNAPDQGLDILMKGIEAKRAAGAAAPEAWYRRGLGVAYNAKKLDWAARFSNALVSAYPTKQNWSGALSVVRMVGNYQPQEMLDLFRLMDRAGGFNEGAEYLDYLTVADPRRLPGESLKIIDRGIAAGMIKATDSFVAESRTNANSRIAADKASLPGLERDARAASATAALAMAAGDAFLSYDNAATAEAMYQIALTKPGVDQGRALTRLGIAQVDQGKTAEAQASFNKVTGVRKPIAELWGIYAAQKAKGG